MFRSNWLERHPLSSSLLFVKVPTKFISFDDDRGGGTYYARISERSVLVRTRRSLRRRTRASKHSTSWRREWERCSTRTNAITR